jgi:hypothetical protein
MSSQLATGSVFVSARVAHPSMALNLQLFLAGGQHWMRRSFVSEVLALLLWHGGSGEVEDVNGNH